MGDASMNWLHSVFILAVAFLAVFLESACGLPRHLFGAQIDLLPALMVYTALTNGIASITLLEGAPRPFKLAKIITGSSPKRLDKSTTVTFLPEHGSLLVMRGKTNSEWQHWLDWEKCTFCD